MKEGKIRFNTVFVSDQAIRDSRIEDLKKWCGTFQRKGLTPVVEGNYTGNLSFRFKDDFAITASGLKSKENLTDESFVYVKDYDEKTNTFHVEGKNKPSSESIMHQLIYGANKEINAVFHGHNDLIVSNAKRLELSVTEKEYESGTVELAKEVLKVLDDNKVVVLRNHGFVSMGRTMNEAGELALSMLKQSKEECENVDS
jgi:L-fuculose-phosphate aldolase